MEIDRKLKLLACQPTIPVVLTTDSRDAHVKSLVEWLGDELDKQPADLTVLPELSTIDYSRETFAHLDELAEEENGSSIQAFSKLAKQRNTTLCFGFPRRTSNGYCISQAALGPDGNLVGIYDKIHLAQYGASMEKEYFQGGEHIVVFEVKGVRIAPIICYDIRIPELCRTLALEQEVALVLHCGAYFRDESFASWPAFAITRAMENQIYLLSLNRTGANYGASMFCEPWIDNPDDVFAFPEHEQACRHFTLDLSKLNSVRNKYSFLRDRRADYVCA